MGNILKMSPQLANLIAAGEVVERPSSVVKELVENSIDANCSEITIYLKNGGLEEIIVIDNGDGMDSEDVEMAFLPHATSKIKNEYDLYRISTLGFRGEAIASIAAVSDMTITSSKDGKDGYKCRYKAGVIQEAGISQSNKGTSVVVKGLFFNTPARLKYMKAAKSELASIMFYVDRIAMAHPEKRFKVYSDEKLVFNTSGSNNYCNLIGELYGLEAAKNIIEASYVIDGYKVHLVFVKPSIYRSNKLEITMICNGRYVKSYLMTNAVIEGFSTYLPIGKYPIGIIYFDIDPLLIDVNVHPTKTEIKLSNEEEMAKKLTEEIKKMLQNINHIPNREVVNNKPIAYQKETIFNNKFEFELREDDTLYSSNFLDKKHDVEDMVNNDDSRSTMEIIKDGTAVTFSKSKIPYMEYVGCIFGTYLLFQNDEGMIMVDQHAAAERINYEKYYNILGNPNQPVSDLLVPIILSFTKSEAIYIEENLDEFSKCGFNLELVGENDYALRSVPLWAHIDNAEDIIHNIIDMMIVNHKIDIIYFRDSIAKQISCKASIKANHQISRNEIDYLINELEKCNNPYTCPHGRPTMIKLSISDIEKMFERIQN
ncbi:MAG: DNA mismatch repair endonuclease MutL [Anaeroplasma sp.]